MRSFSRDLPTNFKFDAWQLGEWPAGHRFVEPFSFQVDTSLADSHLSAAIGKSYTALEQDGIGDYFKDGIFDGSGATVVNGAAVIDPNDIPDDISTDVTIEVDGEHIISQLHTIGDQDFVKVELVEGQLYQIGQYAYTAGDGPSGIPLADAYIELYDAAGNLITEADGGGPNTPSGLDALLTYEADYSGTYYINARAFDQDPTNGTTGDAVGDYELFVDDVTGLVEGPYYDPEDLLYAIDWGGVLVDGTARNPDGDEGIRPTGNEQGEPDDKGTGITGKNVIKIYFAKAGDVYTPEDPTQPGLPPVAVAVGASDFEYDAVWNALHEFEKVADVVYVETQIREEANFHYVTYTGTPGPGVSLLGSMAPPQESDEGLALFNSNDERWNAEGLAQGGFSFVTLIHEFGHGHGLAHPHDTGGGSDIMDGVEPDGPVASYTLGDFELNQSVFTMMSYEDGWQSSPYGNAETDAGYGYLGGLMALDIAAIQDKYGVNEDWAKGDDVYLLKDVNAAGTYFYSIWDAGGTDMIRYKGARDALIDMRPATLEYEAGGGGFVSFADGVFGGYTIANGVVIENARSGNGNDILIGNDVANRMLAGAGDDQLYGGKGNDELFGGTGNDLLDGGAGVDRLLGGAGDDNLDGGREADVLYGGAGQDYVFGNAHNDRVDGGAGDDRLSGGHGDDVLIGGSGRDVLIGNVGADIFVFFEGDTGSTTGEADRIVDFRHHEGDTIHLARIDAIEGGNDDAFTFIGDAAFSNTAGELRYAYDAVSNSTFVSGDTDGDGLADFLISVIGQIDFVQTDFIL